MTPFLASVATYLYQKYPDGLQDVCLVFPNRRAGVFFNRYLASNVKKTVWSPEVRTISELMRDISGLQPADSLTLNFQLYQIYRQIKKSTETFDEFFYWGEMLLGDFDDIDKYLVDARQLFQNLSDLKEIESQFTLPEEQLKIIREFWENIKLHDGGSLKTDFISLWEVLFDIYFKFRVSLQEKGLAYEGMLYRNVAEAIKSDNNFVLPAKRFAIVGFNALNNCEKAFFKYLKKNNLADFFWDYDGYYVDHYWHEAGLFIRENRVMFPPPLDFIFESGLRSPKNIEILSVPSDIGQAKTVPEVLTRWKALANNFTETAVVLADETLLTPVLSSLPTEVSEVNVTLGYPFRHTPVYSFFELLTELQRNVRKYADGSLRFYHRDANALLQHPYLQIICSKEANEMAAYIIRYNRVFMTEAELSASGLLTEIFKAENKADAFIPYLIRVGSKTASQLAAIQTDGASVFHQEYWFTFIKELVRLDELIKAQRISLEFPTLVKIIRKITAGLSISFKGEPLAGLQVMGVLETRNLDFRNLIILSANEGTLPKSDAALSFIPYNLRRGFDLPTIEHQDSIYAYYFYRLLQRAENVALVYNSQSGNRAAEMSRFLYQIKYEQKIVPDEKAMTFHITLSDEKDIVIAKTPEIMDSLLIFTRQHVEPKTLTPTAINSWLECSLRFYFRYVAGIKEREEVQEDIEGSMFGKLLHYAMEKLYGRYVGKQLTAKDFDEILTSTTLVEDCIMEAFAVEFFRKPSESPHLHGKSLVVKEILRKYILRILEVDKASAPITPLEFEKTVETVLPITVNGQSFDIMLGGKIDRIDRTLQSFRVIDYKTGKASRGFDEVGLLFEPQGKKRNKEALQTLLYALVLGSDPVYAILPIIPGLYTMREIFNKKFDFRLEESKVPIENVSQVNHAFQKGLAQVLEQMFDVNNPFVKTSEKKTCLYCDYKEMCHR
jgi:hypothetical protein